MTLNRDTSNLPAVCDDIVHSLKCCAGLTIQRQQYFRILPSYFRITLTPAVRRSTCHALMSAGFSVFRRLIVLNFRINTEKSVYLEAMPVVLVNAMH